MSSAEVGAAAGGGGETLLRQGAEARLLVSTFLGRPCIIKERFAKKYRHPDLDKRLTQQRIVQEARAMVRCREAGVQVPALYELNPSTGRLCMEYLSHAVTVRDHLHATGVDRARHASLTAAIGKALAAMHTREIIHGDLTTSNMLLKPDGSLVMIDFGLVSNSNLPEDRAVDIYVLERALNSTHPNSEPLLEDILAAYVANMSKKTGEQVMTRLEDVRARGRKRSMVG